MREKVLQAKNISRAIRQTVNNKGSSGVDGMPVSELKSYFEKHRRELFTDILSHKYTARAIRGVELSEAHHEIL